MTTFAPGPPRVWFEPTDRWRWWTIATLTGIAGAAMLAVAGLPPLDIHGPTHDIGIMDPLCGMTRAVRFAVTGHLGQAWRYNPGVYLLALLALAAVVRFGVGVSSHRWWMICLGSKWRWAAVGVIGLVMLEINQQHHAVLLIRP